MAVALSELVEKLTSGDKRALARVITIVEDGGPNATSIMREVCKHLENPHVIGVAGPPGVGKSTLIDCLITEYRKMGKRVGVVAVDPTSPLTGGALLGDRVRMQKHGLDDGVFIRSMASRGAMGGLSRAIGAVIHAMDAFGADVIIVETIGRGQLDIDVSNYAHTVVAVLQPFSGDEIQMMKAGLMEVADLFVVNKADLPGAEQTIRMIFDAVRESGRRRGWLPPIVKTSAAMGEGIKEVVEAIERHWKHLVETGLIDERRKRFAKAEIVDIAYQRLRDELSRFASSEEMDGLAERVVYGANPYEVADEVLYLLSERLLSKKP